VEDPSVLSAALRKWDWCASSQLFLGS
jgi:hypothetical protein